MENGWHSDYLDCNLDVENSDGSVERVARFYSLYTSALISPYLSAKMFILNTVFWMTVCMTLSKLIAIGRYVSCLIDWPISREVWDVHTECWMTLCMTLSQLIIFPIKLSNLTHDTVFTVFSNLHSSSNSSSSSIGSSSWTATESRRLPVQTHQLPMLQSQFKFRCDQSGHSVIEY